MTNKIKVAFILKALPLFQVSLLANPLKVSLITDMTQTHETTPFSRVKRLMESVIKTVATCQFYLDNFICIFRVKTCKQEQLLKRLYREKRYVQLLPLPAIISTSFLGWYDAATLDNVKSTLNHCRAVQRWNLQRWTTSNQRCLF